MAEKVRYHLITRLVVIAAIVSLLPLAGGFLLIHHSAKTRLSDVTGENLFWFAERAASAVDVAMLRELEFVSSVARSPAVVSELRQEKEGSAAAYLSGLEETSALYQELVLVNRAGEVVFATEAATDRDASEKKGFQRALERFATARPVYLWVQVADDRSSLTLYHPIRDPAAPRANDLLGLVRAELDAERLFHSVSDFRVGDSGHACLVDGGSGRVLAGRGSDCAEGGDRYVRLEELRRAQKQGARYFLAGVEGPDSFDEGVGLLVGHARPELSRSFSDLVWVVAVEQSLAEAQAPLSPMFRELILYFLGMGLLVLLLAAYMSYKLERPLTPAILDLHVGAHVRPFPSRA